MTTQTIPAAVAFAALHWGGEFATPVERPARMSQRDVDGGQFLIPAGWQFHSEDGFRYYVYADPEREGRWCWTDGTGWGSFGSVTDAGTDWLVGVHGSTHRVPKALH